MESGQSASSHEADYAVVAGAGTSTDPEASSEHGTPQEPDAPSSSVDDIEGVPANVRSLSDWEAITTPDATFLGVAPVERATHYGLAVPGGTYSWSCSSSESITSPVDGAIDFVCPRA